MIPARAARSPRTNREPAVAGGISEPTKTGSAADERRYSIRVTSHVTSIELDTLRMWERRYGFPRPERTRGGSRTYSEADIQSLKLIKRGLDQGYRPGEIVGKSGEELAQLVAKATRATLRPGIGTPTVETVLAALGRDEIATVRAELRQAGVMLGPKRFVVEVAHPVAVRVGELWAAGKLEVRHEHMLSECLSAQLRVMASVYEDRPGAPRVLLTTLPNERHGLGLEMIGVYLAVSQVTPVRLGADTPPDQIVKAARSHLVDAVGILVSEASNVRTTQRQVRWLLEELPRRTALWVGGAGGAALGLRDEAVRIVGTWDAVDEAIATLARGAA